MGASRKFDNVFSCFFFVCLFLVINVFRRGSYEPPSRSKESNCFWRVVRIYISKETYTKLRCSGGSGPSVPLWIQPCKEKETKTHILLNHGPKFSKYFRTNTITYDQKLTQSHPQFDAFSQSDHLSLQLSLSFSLSISKKKCMSMQNLIKIYDAVQEV